MSRHPVKDLLLFFAIVRASRMSVPTATSGQFAHFKGYTDVLEAIRIGFAKAKKRKSVIDFADMLSLAVKEIKGGAKVHYQHILVDEYQDCSPAQTHLLAHLVRSGDRNIMVFGDKYQAIFGFGGATYTPLSRVLDGVSTLRLPKSRRLTVETAALASAVAQHTSKQAIRANRNGVKPVLVIDKTADKQIRHIVRDIQALIAKGVPLNKIVVLARTKALLLPVEQALLDLGVCTNRIGLTRDRKHALRVLRLVEIVEKFEGNNEMSISLDMLKDQLSGLTNVSNERWKNEVSKLKKAVRSTSLEGRYQLCGKTYLRLCGGVRKDPDVRADVNRWEPLCRGQQDTKTMKAKIRSMRIDAVITSTIHSAKGGEWDYVFVVGVTDGLLPWYKSLNDTKSLSEERNLLYVAVTRARVAVRLYHAPTNHSKSRQRFSDVCRFLDKDGVMKTLSLVGRNR